MCVRAEIEMRRGFMLVACRMDDLRCGWGADSGGLARSREPSD